MTWARFSRKVAPDAALLISEELGHRGLPPKPGSYFGHRCCANTLEVIDRLMAVAKLTKGQASYLETLVQLVQAYEAASLQERHGEGKIAVDALVDRTAGGR